MSAAQEAGVVYGWDHLQLRSADPAETAAWFVRHFAAEVTVEPSRTVIRLAGSMIFVARVTEGDGVLPPPRHPHRGLDHFGLTVNDLDRALAALQAGGVTLAEPVKTLRPGVRGCYVEGPDGIWIELLERRAA